MVKNHLVFVFLYIFVFVEKIDSTVQICNRGAYLANCYLESRPFSNGFQIRRTETGLFPVGQCRSLSVPVDAVWNRLESMFDYCYQITGTTLNPQWAQTQCSTNY